MEIVKFKPIYLPLLSQAKFLIHTTKEFLSRALGDRDIQKNSSTSPVKEFLPNSV
ncbi:MAG: hypothetical protein IGS48_00325 [Oscillatoriales cyanobacterium C42_A2020_001]|nr:hypothetical protein [Leptolyngbyaceae cyanobacterium C42_A2020_001]